MSRGPAVHRGWQAARGTRIHPAGALLLRLAVLVALPLACAFRLVLDPGALIVDGERPSLDDAQKVEARSVGNDLTRLFLPHHAALADRVARFGHLPRWDPRGFGGRPVVGNPQGGLFYPPVWLAWRAWTPSVLGWLTVGHLIWAGFGTYTLSRASGLGTTAALVAGGCYEVSPYVLAHAFEGHYPHVWAASWYPWAFWAAWRMRAGCRWGGLALAPILALTFLSGHPQPSYYLVAVLLGWAPVDAVRAMRAGEPREAGRGLLAWGAVFVGALGLIAVEVAPDLAAQGWGLTGGRMGLEAAGRYHLNPLNLLQLLSPGALGRPADYFGHENYWEALLSIGWVPLVLAGIAVARSPSRGLVRGWGTLAAAAVLFAAGRRLGLFALLYWIVPGMDRFRAPGRALFLASLAGAVLAGLGVEALARGPTTDWAGWARRHRRGLALLLIGLAIGQGAARRWDTRPSPRPGGLRTANQQREIARWVRASTRLTRDPVAWIALVGTAVAFEHLRRRPGDRRRVAVALGALALAELGAHGAILLKAAPAARFLAPGPLDAALDRVRPEGPFRVRARDTFFGDLRAWRTGVEKTNINDSYQVQHAADLYEALYSVFGNPGRSALVRPEVRRAVLDRMNVALLVTDRPPADAPWPVAASGLSAGARFAIYRNPTALPRAYVVPRARVVPDDDPALARLAATDAREQVLLAEDPLAAGGRRQAFTPAAYAADDPDRVVIEVATEAPGLLVVADTWMPGWSARLDGRRTPILRGDHAHRVVALPARGRHRVVMTYRPPGLALGLAITAAAGVTWSATALAMAASWAFTLVPARRSIGRLAGPALDRRPLPFPLG